MMHVIEVGGHDGWEDAYCDESSTITLCQAFECVLPAIYDSAWCRSHEDPTSGREDCGCWGCMHGEEQKPTFSVRFGEEKYGNNKELFACDTKEEAVLIIVDRFLSANMSPGYSVWLER